MPMALGYFVVRIPTIVHCSGGRGLCTARPSQSWAARGLAMKPNKLSYRY